MKLAALVALSLSAAACSAQSPRFVVDGVSEEFCVPPAFVAKNVPWVPDDPPGAPHDFSVQGCANARDPQDARNCPLPPESLGVTVHPRDAVYPMHWKEISQSADIGALSKAEGARREAGTRPGTLVVSQLEIWPEWYVWRKSDASRQPLQLEDADTLWVACSKAADYPGNHGATVEGDYVCRRYVVGSEYALSYSFVTNEREPQNVAKLDKRMVNAVEALKCKD